MAYLYVDTDGSGASSPYSSWATAAQTLKAALEDAACVAGSTVYVQGAAKDSYASLTTINPVGAATNPIVVIAVANGTVNTGAGVTEADMVDRHTGTPTVIETTSTNGLTWASANVKFIGLEFSVGGTMAWNSDTYYSFYRCKVIANVSAGSGSFNHAGDPCEGAYYDCELSANTYNAGQGYLYMVGGSLKTTATWATSLTRGGILLEGVDISTSTSTKLFSGAGHNGRAFARHCKLPTAMAINNTNAMSYDAESSYVNTFACSDNTSAKADGDSYQENEAVLRDGDRGISTENRTGGASDQATGAYSIYLTNHASMAANMKTMGASSCRTHWMAVWVAGGLNTLTVYTTHDNAGSLGRDLYETELKCEFLVPSVDDEADHVYKLYGDLSVFDPSSTATAGVADTSTWNGTPYNTYKRKFSHTFTAGYTGWAYARVSVLHDSATPVTVYVDPKIEIS